MTTRRKLLAAAAGASTVALGGCGCEMFAELILAPSRSTLIGPVDGEWRIRGEVYAEFISPNAFPADRFSDVTITVYGTDGEQLASEPVGDFPAEDAEGTGDRCVGDVLTRSIELVPGAFPERIALTAAEMDVHCSEADYQIVDAVRNDFYDVGHSGRLGQYWSLEHHPCPED